MMRIQTHKDRLSLVLEKVREQHPVRRGETVGIGESIIDEVRALLEETGFEELKKLSFQFDSSRLLACVEIVALDQEGFTAEKAAEVALFRPRDSMIVRCWRKLVKTYPSPLLEKLFKGLIHERGYGAVENHKKISNHLPLWLLSDPLSNGIFKDYQSAVEYDTFDSFLSDHFLTTDDALYHVVWLTLLTCGTANDLQRQKQSRILLEMHNRQKASDLMEICQHYLNTLKKLSNWHENILEFTGAKFGIPSSLLDEKRIEHRFWHSVDETARAQFRQWLILKEVESFFEGERAQFWRNYVESGKVNDVNKILAGDGFMLDFGRFGVIEFKNVGNAAYIYPINVFKKFWRSASFWLNSSSHFKDGMKTVRSHRLPRWDGRIVHRSGWQYKAKERIDTIMGER